MTPFRFGPAERELYGVFHASASSVGAAVLLCSPLGQEAIRAHRLYRVLAERLALNGAAVLRFDYYGTGESAGEDSEGELAGWTSDVLAASCELARRASCDRAIWIGVGLGATLAALATTRAANAPERLVLCDPVMSGSEYLSHLAERHAEWLQRSYGAPARTLPFFSTDEVLGLPLLPQLRQQIEELTPSVFTSARCNDIAVVGSVRHADTRRVIDALHRAGRRVQDIPLKSSIEWASEEAMNSALVPVDALRALHEVACAPA